MRKSSRSHLDSGYSGCPSGLVTITRSSFLVVVLLGSLATASEPGGQEPPPTNVTSNQTIDLATGDRVDRGHHDAAQAVPPTSGEIPARPDRAGVRPGASVLRRGTTSEPPPLSSVSTPWYRSGLVALMIVLGVVWLAYRAVRRWIPAVRAAESDVLRVVARTTLAPKQHLALIRVGRQFVLVGVSPDRVDRLCVIDEAEDVSDLAVRTNGAAGQQSRFDEELVREVSEYDREPVLESPEKHSLDLAAPDRRSSLRALLDRLRTLKKA